MTDFMDYLKKNLSEEEEEAVQENLALTHEHNLKQLEDARLFFDVFGHGRGPELLEHLRDCTIELSLLSMTGSTLYTEIGLSPEQWAFLREGQNSLVRYIEKQLKIATTPVDKPVQTETEDNG